MIDVYKAAREAFNEYCSMAPPDLPRDQLQALQVKMFRWCETKVKHKLPRDVEGIIGVSEEFGEIASAIGKINHAILNHYQERRGMEDEEKLRADVADGFADMFIYSLAMLTAQRLDFRTLILGTAENVLMRDWLKNPINAHDIENALRYHVIGSKEPEDGK